MCIILCMQNTSRTEKMWVQISQHTCIQREIVELINYIACYLILLRAQFSEAVETLLTFLICDTAVGVPLQPIVNCCAVQYNAGC